jgi:hypothetical protein
MKKKDIEEKIEQALADEEIKEATPMESDAVNKLLEKVEELERKDIENQKQLKMLYDVADKGRIFNYENQKKDKQAIKVKLSVFRGGLIVGWRTMKDELIKHPTTGLVVGENQEYELLILGKDGQTTKVIVNSYPAFSEARYVERVECEVVSRKEDYNGNISYDLLLPDGRQITLASQFIN